MKAEKVSIYMISVENYSQNMTMSIFNKTWQFVEGEFKSIHFDGCTKKMWTIQNVDKYIMYKNNYDNLTTHFEATLHFCHK